MVKDPINSIEKRKDPTMTKTARALYERDLTRLFRRYKQVILEKFRAEAIQVEQERAIYNELATEIEIARYAEDLESSAYGIIIRPAQHVIDSRIPRIYERGAKSATLFMGETIGGQLGAADWRALDALKVRNLSALKLITNEMIGQVMREITFGLRHGLHPREIAVKIADRVDKIGLSRARVMARTETIFAHNQGAVTRYGQYGAEEVQWYTALDERVCPVCAPRHLRKYRLGSEPENPAHPNCRCTYIPVVD